MNKIRLIIQREYLSRVRKKSFLLMTFLVPLFMIGIYALIIILTKNSFENSQATIHVVDQSGLFASKLEDNNQITFRTTGENAEAEKNRLLEEQQKKHFLLIIPPMVADDQLNVELLASEKAGLTVQNTIENQLEQILRNHQLEESGIDVSTLERIDPQVRVTAKEITEEGEKESSVGAAMIISMILAVIVYITLFIYGSQVMRGIIEEKNNRIVEVIISSVKPFQLMMGKIIGIGLVGLTQFLLWIVLSGVLMAIAGNLFMDPAAMEQMAAGQPGMSAGEISKYQDGLGGSVMSALDTINLAQIAWLFLIYFLGGYLLYSALFAAIGSAVDNETESQQFTFPITLPLLFAYVLSFGVLVNDPHGTLAFWLSMIPLTSPVAMMVRIPFGVPEWQILLSVILLIGGFILTTWIAARIYRVGILMYGKKASYRELVKWFRYRG